MKKAEKAKVVQELRQKIREYPTVAVVDFTGVPADLMQELRAKLRGRGEIKVSKKTLIQRALKEEDKPNIAKLLEYLKGQPALVFSKENPFKLYRFFDENKRRAPAKPGMVSSSDVVLQAGELDLPPGPVVSTLQKLGAKARVQAGRVTLLEDFTLVKAGEVIDGEKADLLAKLNILPIEQMLKVHAAYEKGIIFTPEVLGIRPEQVMEDIKQAQQVALNLSLNSGYPTSETLPVMLQEAKLRGLLLAVNIDYPAREVVGQILAKGYVQMLALARVVGQKDASLLDERIKGIVS